MLDGKKVPRASVDESVDDQLGQVKELVPCADAGCNFLGTQLAVLFFCK